MNKNEALVTEFQAISNLKAQAKTAINEMTMWDFNVFTYGAGELLNANYETVQLGNTANFTQQKRRNIH